MSFEYVQFKSNPLQRLTCTLQNRLSGVRRASKADLIDAWMACQPGTQVVVAAKGLDNARWKELLGKFH